jgi:c-di-GMP-binding flagellar brake protein YcgR
MPSVKRREYYRAQIPIPVKWRVLMPEEIRLARQGLGKNLFRGSGVVNPIDEFLERAAPGSEDEQLYRCLQLINNKLDFLIEQSFLRPDQHAPSRGEVIDISGSGVKFTCRDHVSMGSLLKMDVVIPATSQYQLEMISEVVRIETQMGGYIVACKIMEIDEAAREAIVNVVFQKQRQDNRLSKADREDPDAC